MRKMKLFGLALIGPALLSGCAKTIVVTADSLCKDWRHETVSKADVLTDKTASGIEGNNESRGNWGCARGKNEAKG